RLSVFESGVCAVAHPPFPPGRTGHRQFTLRSVQCRVASLRAAAKTLPAGFVSLAPNATGQTGLGNGRGPCGLGRRTVVGVFSGPREPAGQDGGGVCANGAGGTGYWGHHLLLAIAGGGRNGFGDPEAVPVRARLRGAGIPTPAIGRKPYF